MTTALLILTTLFLASYVVILKICLWVRDCKLTAIEDAVHLYTRRGGAWDDETHAFVQSVKAALKGEL